MTFPSDNFKEIVRRKKAGEDPCKSICEVYGYFDYDDIIYDKSLSEMADAIFGSHKNNTDKKNKNANKPAKKVMTEEEKEKILETIDKLISDYNLEHGLESRGWYVFVHKDNDTYSYWYTSGNTRYSTTSSGNGLLSLDNLVNELYEQRGPAVFIGGIKYKGKLPLDWRSYEDVSVQLKIDSWDDIESCIERLLTKIPSRSELRGLRINKEKKDGIYVDALYESKKIKNMREKAWKLVDDAIVMIREDVDILKRYHIKYTNKSEVESADTDKMEIISKYDKILNILDNEQKLSGELKFREFSLNFITNVTKAPSYSYGKVYNKVLDMIKKGNEPCLENVWEMLIKEDWIDGTYGPIPKKEFFGDPSKKHLRLMEEYQESKWISYDQINKSIKECNERGYIAFSAHDFENKKARVGLTDLGKKVSERYKE